MAASNSGEQVVQGQCHHQDVKDGPVDPSAERQHSEVIPFKERHSDTAVVGVRFTDKDIRGARTEAQ